LQQLSFHSLLCHTHHCVHGTFIFSIYLAIYWYKLRVRQEALTAHGLLVALLTLRLATAWECSWRRERSAIWEETALVEDGAALRDVNEVHIEMEAGWRCRELETVLVRDGTGCRRRRLEMALIADGAALGDLNEVHLEMEAGWRCWRY
jgi:hypothetical protein